MKTSMKRRRSSDSTSTDHVILVTPDHSNDSTQPRGSHDGTGKQPRLSPLYEYLPAESIRLLSVKEVDGRNVHSLETFKKDEAPDYDALSYCWGEDVRSSAIICNGHTLEITPSLFGALQEVLKVGMGNQPLWVDAICLNQNDEDEKAVHVLQMYSIYANACQVVVWLGHADAETPEVIFQMERILRKLKEPNLQNFSRHSNSREVLSHGLPADEDPIWRSIGRLLHRPWFQRLWPLQEIAFAKNINFRCGPLLSTWTTIRDFVREIQRVGLLYNGVMEYEVPWKRSQIWFYISQIDFLQQISRGDKLNVDLVRILQIARTKSCEQPIDRLWAMLGFTGPQFRRCVLEKGLIDYSESGKRDFWKSYVAVAKLILLEHDPHLQLLSLAEPHLELPQLPTWCPNWHAKESLLLGGNAEYYGAGLINGIEAWNAKPHFVTDSTLLQVLGCEIDTVKDLVSRDWLFSGSFKMLRAPDGLNAHLLAWDQECRQLSHETIGGDPFWEEAHVRTIIGDVTSHDLSYDQLQDQYRIWKDWIEHSVRRKDARNIKHEWHTCLPFYDAMQAACAGRKFFSTEEGRIGIGSPSLLPGDQLCVLINGRPVYILRRSITSNEGEHSPTKYNLMGNAYVDGLMNGEAFDLDDRPPIERLSIC